MVATPPNTRLVRNGPLWFAALAGAVAWALHILIIYPLVRLECRRGSVGLILGVSAACALVALAGGAVALRLRDVEAPDPAVTERARLMARTGFLLNVLFFLVIVAETVPVFYTDPCHAFEEMLGALRAAGAIGEAHAHPLRAAPASLSRTWTFDPVVLCALGLSALLYLNGARRRRRARRGGPIAFFAGLAVLGLALLSPIDALGAALFSAHMVQHLLLTLLAAPLLVWGGAGGALFVALPRGARRRLQPWLHPGGALWRLGALLRRPLPVTGLHLLALWLWHVPALYEAALRSEILHALEHACLLGSAALLWTVVHDAWARRSAASGAYLLTLFGTALHTGLLGALMTLSPVAWYPSHAGGVAGWARGPLEDQQLAGLIMWVPGGVAYLGAALALASAWIDAAERRVRRREARALGAALPLLAAILAGASGCQRGQDQGGPPWRALGEAGRLVFDLALSPERPAPGALFSVTAAVHDARSGAPLRGAQVTIDATMPEHGHGMMTTPEHRELGDGRYRSSGLKLHMPGAWRFDAQAARGALRDRVTLPYEQAPWRPGG